MTLNRGCNQLVPRNSKLPGSGRLKRIVRDINNSQRRGCCVESCDYTLTACQAADFATFFFFGFDNGAAVALGACLSAAQRLICA